MPTITLGELRKLIETTSYEKFAREGSRPHVRGRPQSASVKRERSRSRSRTRSYIRPQSADKRSKPVRPQSATVVLHYRPQKTQTTPRKRPDSAKSVTCVPRQDVKKVDFTGLNNMMKSMTFSANRGWKSKSMDFSDTEKKTNEDKQKTEKQEAHEVKHVDTNTLRKNRSSSFSKFKYPLTNQCLQKHRNRMCVEENIPASLRRLPKYSNQPRRMNCSYTPPGFSVTKVKQHMIVSKTLPPPPPDLSKKPPLPPSSINRSSSRKNSETVYMAPGESDQEQQRNATYHYVHNGGDAEVTLVLPGDDEADFRTPRDLSPIPTSVIVPVQETPRDSTARPDDSARVEKLPDISEDVNEKTVDRQSNASDDSFLVKDEVENNNVIFGSDEDKHSYGDMDDLQSLPSELSFGEDNPGEKKSAFKASSHQVSSDDEIEEDIPEEVNVKPINFIQKRPKSSFKP